MVAAPEPGLAAPEPGLAAHVARPAGADGFAGTAVVDGVLFDVDDTVVDTAGAFGVAIAAVRHAFLPHVPVEREPEMLAIWRGDVHGRYRAYTRGELDFDEQRRLRADELHAAFGGPPVDEVLYPRWLEVFWGAFQESWRAFDDVAAVLTTLVASGIRVGAVTNARAELQESKLAAARIEGLPVLVGVDTLGYGKPRPEVFLEGCRRLGTDPARTAYVGDEPDIDARAAADAGLLGVWLERPGSQRSGLHADVGGFVAGPRVHRVGGLADLPGLLGL
ncbi:HAD-superfamily hydrolase, subfamily IA, variant 1 [Xylanimonas cellulosilytica DSM 15894]|uniref:HAD-superfamily hydrolase, subfamily IA, variant 1 n=1 Tax=Xylanimonas cellulosilytica (strain DSM 15894 / JCM 12276 / CECT 5975 / KCTC 9989 / LMG 20990 / NBRC 107835 / XIL07) TaxID=446471 RepID=D1BVQ9_XYLCX|nr:HAD-IA family hydrolase [Xylanimonas cellulosilytica]ACZ31378.1 HAD-superfamily hydrolase, subfamily IA, variant 1 [Xylanimonas cellulosilytica DSM 15894]